MKGIVNQITIDSDVRERAIQLIEASEPATEQRLDLPGSVSLINDVLAAQVIDMLVGELDQHPWTAVGLDGILANTRPGDPIGSWRASIHDQSIADAIWKRLEPLIGGERSFDRFACTDWDGHATWRATGINPLFRAIRYRDAGLLVPHYDAPYVQDADHRTLVTLVLYLQCDEDVVGGATRFIADEQLQLPFAARNHADWTRLAREDEIIEQVPATAGRALVFDHRILHDSQPLTSLHGGVKTILRTDVMYERVS